MRNRRLSTIAGLLLALGGAGTASAINNWQTTQECNFSGHGSATLNHGLYLTSYLGNNLSQVELGYTAKNGFGGPWSITMTARRKSFDGPILGIQTITVIVPEVSTNDEVFGVFDFRGVPVTPGDTITFTQTAQRLPVDGGSIYFDVGVGSCPHVFETFGTTPPLDTVLPARVGLVTTEYKQTTACIASDTIMCIDDNPGDRRFKVTASFHTAQNGGIAGKGQEIPGRPLGIDQGGFFWFFEPANPEMLVKVIDGCAINGHHWVFLSAGTNVAFNVLVTDTATGHTATYSNPDLNAALPVQDTGALTCP